MPLVLVVAVAWLAATAGEANPPYWQITRYNLWHIPDDSDAFDVSFSCQKEPYIAVEIPVGEDVRSASIRLASGAARGRYPAKVTPSEIGNFAKARVAKSDPVLKAFQATGKLTVEDGWDADAKSARERQAIAAFFKSCPLR